MRRTPLLLVLIISFSCGYIYFLFFIAGVSTPSFMQVFALAQTSFNIQLASPGVSTVISSPGPGLGVGTVIYYL